MSEQWIVDVLGDLRAFARANDLPVLADQLDEVMVVARVELAQSPVRVERVERDGAQAGRSVGAAS